MSWAWLTGTPVLLLTFIGTVIGIIASLIAIVPIARRAVARHPRTAAMKQIAPTLDTSRRIVRTLLEQGWKPPPPPPGSWRAILERMQEREGRDRTA